jgi:hypothetical protein
MRAKFTLNAMTEYPGHGGKTLRFNPVSDASTPENERFTKYTPSGSLEMLVDNPAALAEMKLGQAYYLDFTPAP